MHIYGHNVILKCPKRGRIAQIFFAIFKYGSALPVELLIVPHAIAIHHLA